MGRKPKLARKIEKSNLKERQKNSGKRKGGSGKGFDQAGTPFHPGELPSQYNLENSELERVGRTQRRKEW